MKVYKVSRLAMIFIPAASAGMLALVGLTVGPSMVRDIKAGAPQGWFFLVWVAFIFWGGYSSLKMPFEIMLADDNSLEFRSVLGRTLLRPSEIRSIRGSAFGGGFIEFKHTNGKLKMYQGVDGLYELISTLKSLNPTIEVKGY